MFPFTISDKAVTVFIDGQPRSFASSHASYGAIRDAVLAGDEEVVRSLTDVKAHIAKTTFGRVQIFDTEILVDGRQVSGRLVDRILEMVRLGSDAISGYVKFLDNLLNNPSRTAVDELYLFIEACNLPITPDGHFLAYKRVRADYKDIHSGTFDNSVGQVLQMARNEVDDNRNNTCSQGLHFCSYDYLPHFGHGGSQDKVMVLKINPADVVSIPSDYNNSKGRTWRYEVVGEIEWEQKQITPWYTSEYTDTEEEFEEEFDDGFDVDEETGEIIERDDSDNKYATKLTWAEVRDIRALLSDGVSLTDVARMFGISRRQAARIRDFECWVDDEDDSQVPY